VFGLRAKNRKYYPKEKVIAIELGGVTKAYLFPELKKVGPLIKDVIGKITFQIFYDRNTKTVVVRD
jgi:hypothetical protein